MEGQNDKEVKESLLSRNSFYDKNFKFDLKEINTHREVSGCICDPDSYYPENYHL
jgi:hypothetical protein